MDVAKGRWEAAVRSAFARCEEVVRTHASTMRRVCDRADKYAREIASPVVRGVLVPRTARQELQEALRRERADSVRTIERECDIALRLARVDGMQMGIGGDVGGGGGAPPQLAALRGRGAPRGAERQLRARYEAKLLEYERQALAGIRRECERTWLAALQSGYREALVR